MKRNSSLKITSFLNNSKRSKQNNFNTVLRRKKGYESVTEFSRLSKQFHTSNDIYFSIPKDNECLSSDEDYTDEEDNTTVFDSINFGKSVERRVIDRAQASATNIPLNVKTVIQAKISEYECKFLFFIKRLKNEERAKETFNTGIVSDFFYPFAAFLFPKNFIHINHNASKKERDIKNGLCFSESKGSVPHLYRVCLSSVENLEERQLFTIMVLTNYSFLCKKNKVWNGYIKCSDNFVKDVLNSNEFNYVTYMRHKFLPLFLKNCYVFK